MFLDPTQMDQFPLVANDFGRFGLLSSLDSSMTAENHRLYQVRNLELVSEDVVAQALMKDPTSSRVMAKGLVPEKGQVVGVRLNLNVLKNQGVPVQSVHAGNKNDGYKRNIGLYRGSVICYQSVVTLRNAFLNVNQAGREKIASGQENKFSMASIDGSFTTDMPVFDGIEISFNPKRVRLFVDAENRPIRFAEEVTIYANRAYVRGRIEYYTEITAPEKTGNSPCEVRF